MLRLNYNRRPHTTHTRMPLKLLAQVTKETVLLGSKGHLLHKLNLTRAEPPNTLKKKKAQRISQNKEKRKHVPNNRTGQNCRKRTKENGYKQLTRFRVKTVVKRVLKNIGEEMFSVRTLTKIYKT